MTAETKLDKSLGLDLSDILWLLAGQIRDSRHVSEAQFAWFQSHVNSDFSEKQLHRLAELRASMESALLRTEQKIMSQLTDFADKVDAFQKDQSDAIDALGVSLGGLTGDVASLKQQIIDLQNSPGPVTPEDQARLDKIQATAEAAATKSKALSEALAALDAQTENAPEPT